MQMRGVTLLAAFATCLVTSIAHARDEAVICGIPAARWNRAAAEKNPVKIATILAKTPMICRDLRRNIQDRLDEIEGTSHSGSSAIISAEKPKEIIQSSRTPLTTARGKDRSITPYQSPGGIVRHRPGEAARASASEMPPVLVPSHPIIFEGETFRIRLSYLWIKKDGFTIQINGTFIPKVPNLRLYKSPNRGASKLSIDNVTCLENAELTVGTYYDSPPNDADLNRLPALTIGQAMRISASGRCETRPKVGDVARIELEIPFFDGETTTILSVEVPPVRISNYLDQ